MWLHKTETILRFQAAHQNQNQFNLPIFILGISHTKGRSVWMPMILLFSSNCIHEYQWILYEQYEGLAAPPEKKKRKIKIQPARNAEICFFVFFSFCFSFASCFAVAITQSDRSTQTSTQSRKHCVWWVLPFDAPRMADEYRRGIQPVRRESQERHIEQKWGTHNWILAYLFVKSYKWLHAALQRMIELPKLYRR